MISVNGSAARHIVAVGDLLIIAAFAQVSEEELRPPPKLVFVNDQNQQVELRDKVATQMM